MSDSKRIRTEKPRKHWLERSFWADVLGELAGGALQLLIRAIGKVFHHLL